MTPTVQAAPQPGDLPGDAPPHGAPGASPTSPRCPACSAAVSPDDGFCEDCGADLKVRRAAPPDGDPIPCPNCGTVSYTDGYCDQCGRLEPSPRDRIERDLGFAAGVSDKGLRHSRNEDAMAFAVLAASGGEATSVVVVCDGVSTSTDPHLASQAAADAALDVLVHELRLATPAARSATAAIAAAQRAVTALADDYPDASAAPSCTIAAAVLENGRVTVGWLGDSRVYWLAGPGGTSKRLTDDDTWAGQMIADGALGEEEAYQAPLAHAIMRWLGPDAPVGTAHVAQFQPEGAGLVLVCSDGLWNYVWDAAQLAALVAEQPGGVAAQAARLTEIALTAGGHDNITAVLAVYPPTAPPAPQASQSTQTTAGDAPRVPSEEGTEQQ